MCGLRLDTQHRQARRAILGWVYEALLQEMSWWQRRVDAELRSIEAELRHLEAAVDTEPGPDQRKERHEYNRSELCWVVERVKKLETELHRERQDRESEAFEALEEDIARLSSYLPLIQAQEHALTCVQEEQAQINRALVHVGSSLEDEHARTTTVIMAVIAAVMLPASIWLLAHAPPLPLF